MKIARLFDTQDASGEWTFAPGRACIADPERRARIAEFLSSGMMIVRVPGLDVDRLDRSRGQAVPLSTLTDGTWIWSAGLRYYLEVHAIAPEPEFLAHMAACEYQAVEPEESAWRAALEVLRANQR